MKRKEIENLASMKDSEIQLCKVTEHSDKGITFIVDEGLSKPKYHLHEWSGKSVVVDMLEKKQIENNEVFDIIKCSFAKDKFANIGSDTLYKCMVQCFAEHRPLVLSPDIIWLLISQTLSNHIYEHAEEFRDKIVSHKGKLDLEVESEYAIKDKRLDWSKLLDGFYCKIAEKTKNNIAQKIVSNFSTTSADDRICSIATLMHGVEAYFTYSVSHMICGIPYITLQGTEEDWKNLLKKSSVLKEYGLSYWYKWLYPILKEFVRASSGKPHLDFWKSIVQIAHEEDFSTGRGCCPDIHDVDGWCVALFPHVSWKTGRMCYDKCVNTQRMKPETTRVGFKYKERFPNGDEIVTPMELWSGIVGVEEDKKTFALTPKVGWFVRKSHEHEETLNRLKGANEYRGIELEVDNVPDILNELDSINELTLTFKDRIILPEWMFNKPINKLILNGTIDDEYKNYLKRKFEKICINEDPWDLGWYDHNDEEKEDEEPLYGYVGSVAQLGLYHDLPVHDIKATAIELSKRFGTDIRMYYRNRWKYDYKRHLISRNHNEKEIELLKIENDDYYNSISIEVDNYNIECIRLKMGDKTFESLTYDNENTEHFFGIEYKEQDTPLFSFWLNRETVKIYKETVDLGVEISGGYYSWEKLFHCHEELPKTLFLFRKSIKAKANLFGCKEIVIYPNGYGPTREIKERSHWNVKELLDYIRTRHYLDDFDGECGGDINKWRSNERHINFQKFVDRELLISNDDFISIIFDHVI